MRPYSVKVTPPEWLDLDEIQFISGFYHTQGEFSACKLPIQRAWFSVRFKGSNTPEMFNLFDPFDVGDTPTKQDDAAVCNFRAAYDDLVLNWSLGLAQLVAGEQSPAGA